MSMRRTSAWWVIVTRGAVLSAARVEVRALHALLRVGQRRPVAGREGADGLGAHHHPGVLDHLEHLRDAVVHLAEQVADRGDAVLPERELAGRGRLEAHLVLDVRDERAVALAELAGAGSKWNFGTRNSDRPFVPGCGVMPGALRAGQHEVHDVLGQVVLGRGDEPLHAVEVPGAVGLRDGPGPARADVRPGVRLGEHHRRAPAALDHQLGPAPLLRRAEAVHDRGEARAAQVEEHRRVGAEDQLGGGPLHGRRGRRGRPARPAGPAATTRPPTAAGRPASPARGA